MTVYDYLYVDRDKVMSLYSQLTGGVVELREASVERSLSADNKRHYDFKIFRHDAGGTAQDRDSTKAVVKPHHSVLLELEEELMKRGYLVDLTQADDGSSSFRDEQFRERLRKTLCVKILGRTVIEDYERIKSIAGAFPQIAALVNKSAESTLKQSPTVQELQTHIDRLSRETKNIKDRNERAAKGRQLTVAQAELDSLLKAASKVGGVEQWILDGFKTWIDTFLPGIVNLRVYPNIDRPDEHVFGHLKKHCFEDPDTNSFHFTYGSMPTEPLTILGVVSSVPSESDDEFAPLGEFEKEALKDYESVEKAFRGMFRGFDGLERMIRTSRFPRILVHPLTVYRSVEPNP